MLYICQKLWKLAESRHSYYNERCVQFFWPTLYVWEYVYFLAHPVCMRVCIMWCSESVKKRCSSEMSGLNADMRLFTERVNKLQCCMSLLMVNNILMFCLSLASLLFWIECVSAKDSFFFIGWSVAVLTTWCQTPLSLAFLQAVWTPKFKDWRSSSIVLSQLS